MSKKQNHKIDNLFDLFLKLTKEEKKSAKHHLALVSNFEKNNKNFINKLFIVLEDRNLFIEWFDKQEKLEKTDFLTTLYETILTHVVVENQSSNLIYKMNTSVIQGILKIRYLSSRGLTSQAIPLLEAQLKLAKEFEFYDEVVKLLKLKQGLIFNHVNQADFDKLNNEISQFEYIRKLSNKVKIGYRSLVNRNFRKVEYNQKQLNDFFRLVKYTKSKFFSPTMDSYYLLVKGDKYFEEKKWKFARQSEMKLMRLISDNKVLYSDYRMVMMYEQLCKIELNLFNFNAALVFIEKALFYDLKRKKVSWLTKTLALTINIILNRGKEIDKLLKELEGIVYINGFQYVKDKVLFIKAMLLFLKYDFTTALLGLGKIKEMIKDKEGYNLWVRIYRLFCLIELEDYEKVEKELESFRKFISRLPKEEQLSERVLLVVTLFKLLQKNYYNFQSKAIKESLELKQLSSLDKRFIWNPDSPELILIHDWVWSKIERREYQPNLMRYKAIE